MKSYNKSLVRNGFFFPLACLYSAKHSTCRIRCQPGIYACVLKQRGEIFLLKFQRWIKVETWNCSKLLVRRPVRSKSHQKLPCLIASCFTQIFLLKKSEQDLELCETDTWFSCHDPLLMAVGCCLHIKNQKNVVVTKKNLSDEYYMVRKKFRSKSFEIPSFRPDVLNLCASLAFISPSIWMRSEFQCRQRKKSFNIFSLSRGYCAW